MKNTSSKIKWTEEKKIVWKTVKEYTRKIMTGEIEGFLKYFHKNYSSWNYFEELPVNKSDIQAELQYLPKLKINSYKLKPVSVQIINEVAIVHYYYSAEFKNSEGIKKIKSGRYTDILLKDLETWMLISDHVGNNALTNMNNYKEINKI